MRELVVIAAVVVCSACAGSSPRAVPDDDAGITGGGSSRPTSTPCVPGDPATPPDQGDDGCQSGVQIIGAGTYSGSTCGCADGASHSCNRSGTPDRRFQIFVPPGDHSCTIYFYPGFLSSYQVGGNICTQHDPGDGAALGLSGGEIGRDVLISVEFLFGGCGEYKFAISCGGNPPPSDGTGSGSGASPCEPDPTLTSPPSGEADGGADPPRPL